MAALEVSLFGNVRISLDQGEKEVHLTRIIQSLFAFLVIQRNRAHPREVLANLFWGESTEEHARGCLSTALWRLRQAIESNGAPPGTYLLVNPLGEVGFNQLSDYWLDVAEFETHIGGLLSQPLQQVREAAVQAAENSLELYRGDLLDGLYEDWALHERERLRFLYLNGLSYLMRLYKHQQSFEKSLVCGQRILTLDPLREEIHREMIHLYLDSGQRTLALRQYEFCRKALEEELRIAPMEETQAIFARASSTRFGDNSQHAASDPQSLAQLRDQLENTRRTIDTAREQVYLLIEEVDQLLGRS